MDTATWSSEFRDTQRTQLYLHTSQVPPLCPEVSTFVNADSTHGSLHSPECQGAGSPWPWLESVRLKTSQKSGSAMLDSPNWATKTLQPGSRSRPVMGRGVSTPRSKTATQQVS